MNVNQKGVRGVLKCLTDLHEKGCYTFTAFDDHSPVDIISMDKTGNIKRLQVKYKAKDHKGYYQLVTFSVVNGKRIPIDRSMIDGWAVYLEDDKKVVYIPIEFMEKRKSLNINPEHDYGLLFR